MVLVVHGGPWARDAWGYDPQAQFLANRGYAVLQVNYRGSTGFGKRSRTPPSTSSPARCTTTSSTGSSGSSAEGIADRGARRHLRRLLRRLRRARRAPPSRPTSSPRRSACVGPSSLVTLVALVPALLAAAPASTWFRYVGDPDDPEQLADLEARSPLNRVDRDPAPLLVIQGANDPRVTKAGVRPDRRGPARARRRVEYLVKDDEGHGFVKPENRMDAYGTIERFLARHLGGRVAG